MDNRCKAILASGPNKNSQCTLKAKPGSQYCGNHRTLNPAPVPAFPNQTLVVPAVTVTRTTIVRVVPTAPTVVPVVAGGGGSMLVIPGRAIFQMPSRDGVVGGGGGALQDNDNNAPVLPARAVEVRPIPQPPLVLDQRQYYTGASKLRFVELVKMSEVGAPYYVCNVIGSSKDKAKWKEFWLAYTGQAAIPTTCAFKDCERKLITNCHATGHMYWRDDPDGQKYNYFAQICKHHNGEDYDYNLFEPRKTKWLPLKKTALLVKIRQNPIVKETQDAIVQAGPRALAAAKKKKEKAKSKCDP